jgi:hypothetical protein
MRYHAESFRRDYGFNVTDEELLSLLAVEGLNCQLKDHTALSTYLDTLPGISGSEYDGHYGGRVYASVSTEEGDGEWEWRLGMVDRAIGYFMDDARRLVKYFPSVVSGDYDTDNDLSMIYSDENFVLLKDGDGTVLVGHADGIKRLQSADFILDTVSVDVHERRHLEDENIWLPVNPSRELADVRKWVASFVDLPTVSELPTISVESRWLSMHVPSDSRPIWANDDFILSEKGENLAATFKTRDSTGTKYYIDAARDQLMEMVREANANSVSGSRLAKYLETQVGSDLARAPKFL